MQAETYQGQQEPKKSEDTDWPKKYKKSDWKGWLSCTQRVYYRQTHSVEFGLSLANRPFDFKVSLSQ